MRSAAKRKAQCFLSDGRKFRLGELPTEQSHSKTLGLAETIRDDLAAGVQMIQAVDEDIPPVAREVFAQKEFRKLVVSMRRAIATDKRIFFTGCGSTGRLSILLEAAWRRFWQELRRDHSDLKSKLPDLEDSIFSVKAGGDYSLIRSVESFEDFADFGKYQLTEAGISDGDVVVAITEGGETSFVIGTAWQALDAGAEAFFVYNNPTGVLRRCVERSRQVIEEPRITKLDLATGPMAIAGSTRMQATTIELLVVGAALEMALTEILREHLCQSELAKLKVANHLASDYHKYFGKLLQEISAPSVVNVIARMVEFETELYSQNGLVTYMADSFLLDILTDTTERSPTFSLPPFKKFDDAVSPPSWAFVKNPLLSTRQAWYDMLQRQPCGLDWNAATYRRLGAPDALQESPPKLDNTEIYKFQIGNEEELSRYNAQQTALVMVLVGEETDRLTRPHSPFRIGFERYAKHFTKTSAICVGTESVQQEINELFHVRCQLYDSPLNLWAHLAIKLVLNTVSTATMALMGRVMGNGMVHVETTNKKLIDRGTRLVAELTGLSYENACYALHETIEELENLPKNGQERPSPVWLTIKRLKN